MIQFETRQIALTVLVASSLLAAPVSAQNSKSASSKKDLAPLENDQISIKPDVIDPLCLDSAKDLDKKMAGSRKQLDGVYERLIKLYSKETREQMGKVRALFKKTGGQLTTDYIEAMNELQALVAQERKSKAVTQFIETQKKRGVSVKIFASGEVLVENEIVEPNGVEPGFAFGRSFNLRGDLKGDGFALRKDKVRDATYINSKDYFTLKSWNCQKNEKLIFGLKSRYKLSEEDVTFLLAVDPYYTHDQSDSESASKHNDPPQDSKTDR